MGRRHASHFCPVMLGGASNPNRADETSDAPGSEIAHCFLRLANLDNGAFECANRYETALWRQVAQILLTIDFLRRTNSSPGE